tara:strand:+ start:2383 stop:2577 length:195 start_codon:yes stop_codon:yes gene_type:complete
MYYNSIRFYSLALKLEAYQVNLERSARRPWWSNSTAVDWASVWLEKRVLLEPEVRHGTVARPTL